MNATRLWVIGAIVVAAGLLAIGWFAGVQPNLTEAAKTEMARLDAVEVNAMNELALGELKQQFEDLDELEDELADLQVAVPLGLDAPGLYREVMANAAALGVSVTELAIGEPRAYGALACACASGARRGRCTGTDRRGRDAPGGRQCGTGGPADRH